MLVPWWEGKPLASWMVIIQMQMSEIKQRSSEMAKSFTLFSARCFPIGGPDLWGNLANLLGGESQNNGRTSKNSHTVESFLPCSYPGLALITYRDIWLTPNDMVYVWVPWGWFWKEPFRTISHFISWVPSCMALSNLVEKRKILSHFPLSFPPTKA